MKRNHFIFLLLFTSSFFSCEQAKLRRTVQRFTGTEIVLPNISEVYFNGEKTEEIVSFDGSLCKMIIYYNPKVCGSCRLANLWEWEPIIELANEMDSNFIPIFIFAPSPEERERFLINLRHSYFEWPIFIDMNHDFEKTNPSLPKEEIFHTFLLDKNNHVLVIGNPTTNDAILGTYKSVIETLIENQGILPVDFTL